VSLLLEDAGPTGAILSGVLGFSESGRDGAIRRYSAPDVKAGAVVGGFQRAGSVHHVPFRAEDDTDQPEMVRKLLDDYGVGATEQMDRKYFRSVYFREPGHVLFEIATDPPGFAVDEPVETLGQALELLLFLETQREKIEAMLPKLS